MIVQKRLLRDFTTECSNTDGPPILSTTSSRAVTSATAIYPAEFWKRHEMVFSFGARKSASTSSSGLDFTLRRYFLREPNVTFSRSRFCGAFGPCSGEPFSEEDTFSLRRFDYHTHIGNDSPPRGFAGLTASLSGLARRDAR